MKEFILFINDNGSYILFIIFLLGNIFDWITGWCKARINKKENSNAGFLGVIKKLAYWLIIFCSFLLSYSFIKLGVITNINMNMAYFLGWFVLISLIVNEFRSILENLVECDIEIPNILIKGLEVFDKKLKDIIDDEKTN